MNSYDIKVVIDAIISALHEFTHESSNNGIEELDRLQASLKYATAQKTRCQWKRLDDVLAAVLPKERPSWTLVIAALRAGIIDPSVYLQRRTKQLCETVDDLSAIKHTLDNLIDTVDTTKNDVDALKNGIESVQVGVKSIDDAVLKCNDNIDDVRDEVIYDIDEFKGDFDALKKDFDALKRYIEAVTRGSKICAKKRKK